jgi:hypothetical protein
MTKMFPIQPQRGAQPHPLLIPWSVAELAYSVYAAQYGRRQSLERLAERGGFGPLEMDEFLPDWREQCSEIVKLRKRVEEQDAEIVWLRDELRQFKDALFQKHLEWASAEVKTWPLWKQNILGSSLKPQWDTPREPVDNGEDRG